MAACRYEKVHSEDNSEALSVAFIEVTDNLNSSLLILIELDVWWKRNAKLTGLTFF